MPMPTLIPSFASAEAFSRNAHFLGVPRTYRVPSFAKICSKKRWAIETEKGVECSGGEAMVGVSGVGSGSGVHVFRILRPLWT